MIIGKPGQDHSMIADEVLQLAGELGLIKYISCDSNYFYDFSKKGWKVIKRAYSEHFTKYDKPSMLQHLTNIMTRKRARKARNRVKKKRKRAW